MSPERIFAWLALTFAVALVGCAPQEPPPDSQPEPLAINPEPGEMPDPERARRFGRVDVVPEPTPPPARRAEAVADTPLLSADPDPGGGGRTAVRFFGAESKAPSIVYVVDKSGSMAWHFAYVQAELARSIADLKPVQQFAVVFFADGKPYILEVNGRKGMTYAVPKAKAAAKDWIDRQIAFSKTGRTDPCQSLEVAFSLKPDLIYLLTDGLFPDGTPETLRRLNARRKVIINTIAFKDNAGEKMLKQIARENGGIYKFIPEHELGADY
jgi:hypothetical protein